jgi:hypothetical protein
VKRQPDSSRRSGPVVACYGPGRFAFMEVLFGATVMHGEDAPKQHSSNRWFQSFPKRSFGFSNSR